ncbi:MAG: hypothetical protein IH616_22465 [Gemmatimonadales bacterium]|nr:hypothetical protein [Gemmatimonadales bacterium]
MKRAAVGALLVVLGAAACATRQAPLPLTPAEHVQAGLDALEQDDLSSATEHLTAAAEAADGSLGRQARLLGAAVALDPRNPARDPNLAARMAGEVAIDEGAAWEAALARTLYSLSLDLGATGTAASRDLEGSADLPHLSAPSLAARMRQLETAVAELRQELARIRETLKP